MCLLQLSCLPQWTLILPISSSSQHVSSESPVNTSPDGHPCCRRWVWKRAYARTWPLESTWFEAQMRRKHHFHSEATNLISPRWMIPESEVPKKVCKRTDLPLQVKDSRSMLEVKLFGDKKGDAAERSPLWLQPVRTWNEMCLAGGLPLVVRTIILTLSEWSSVLSKHFSIECFLLRNYVISNHKLYVVFMFVY